MWIHAFARNHVVRAALSHLRFARTKPRPRRARWALRSFGARASSFDFTSALAAPRRILRRRASSLPLQGRARAFKLEGCVPSVVSPLTRTLDASRLTDSPAGSRIIIITSSAAASTNNNANARAWTPSLLLLALLSPKAHNYHSSCFLSWDACEYESIYLPQAATTPSLTQPPTRTHSRSKISPHGAACCC